MITLVTVTYNAEATLERTMQSVAQQTCTDYEHIIVDGASRDGTLSIARRYEQTGRVVIVSEPDKGLYDAMNKGLRLAKGDYVCFLNAGDKLHSADTLQRITDAVRNTEAGVVYGHTDIVDAEGNFLSRRRLQPPAHLTWRSFRNGMLVCHQAFYVNRKIAQTYDLTYRFSADFDWCIRCMQEGKRLGLPNVALPMHNGDVPKAPDAILTVADYLNEGMTTANHKASLRERMHIMAKHYGWTTTLLMHVWFIMRNLIKQ